MHIIQSHYMIYLCIYFVYIPENTNLMQYTFNENL